MLFGFMRVAVCCNPLSGTCASCFIDDGRSAPARNSGGALRQPVVCSVLGGLHHQGDCLPVCAFKRFYHFTLTALISCFVPESKIRDGKRCSFHYLECVLLVDEKMSYNSIIEWCRRSLCLCTSISWCQLVDVQICSACSGGADSCRSLLIS